MSVDNNDGTYTAVKIIGIAPGVFKDKNKIKAIRLSDSITEIPDDAFDGCSSLEYIKYNKTSHMMSFPIKEAGISYGWFYKVKQ